MGVEAGDRVAVVEPGGVRFASLLHACVRLRSAMVPISVRAPASEVNLVLEDCRPRVVVRDGEAAPLPDPVRGDEGDATILYTSGTTGAPKGVRLTLANHVASALGCERSLDADEHDRWLLVLSPHHVGGLAIFMRSVVSNQPVVTVSGFDEAAVLAAIEQERPTLVSLVPAMLVRLLGAGGQEPLRSLRAILVGGAPASAEQVREWARRGLNVCPTYGLTETCSQVSTVPPGRALDLAGTAGFGHGQASIEIEGGEIVVSGPTVSPGYVNADLRPAPANGRFRTGDSGRLRPDGALEVLGRMDDAIITGGENVQPEEVEAVLRSHPAVRDAAVAGRPDATWGQVLEALVVAHGAGADEIIAFCRERLPSFKVPRRILFVESLPRSEAGKLLRGAL